MIAITGAGGRFGRELMEFLASKGLPLRAVDLLDRPWFENHQAVIGDLTLPSVAKRAVADAEVVIHLAEVRPEGEVLQRYGLTGYDKLMFRQNFELTRTLATAAREAGVARFIFSSSDCVYGPPPRQCPCTEQTVAEPNGPYGRSKLEAETMLLEMHRRGELEAVILRFAMPLGPFLSTWGLLNQFFELALRNLPIPIGGGGGKLTHCVHSRDAVDIIERCLTRPQAAGRVYNVAAHSAATIEDIIDAVTDALGSHSITFHLPSSVMVLANTISTWFRDPFIVPEFALSQSMHTCYETGRALADLGWRAHHDTIQCYVDAALWYREHMRNRV